MTQALWKLCGETSVKASIKVNFFLKVYYPLTRYIQKPDASTTQTKSRRKMSNSMAEIESARKAYQKSVSARKQKREEAFNSAGYVTIPYTGGQLYDTKTGKFLHQANFMHLHEFDGKKRAPSDIIIRCHDVWGSRKIREVTIPATLTWTEVLEHLEQEFGAKYIFDYQDRGGIPIKVDDAMRWERFCAAADDSVLPGQMPKMDVFLREWKYVEPKFANPFPEIEVSQEKIPEPNEWSSGLFACCSDSKTCLLGTAMPCVLYARMVMKLGEDYRGACLSCLVGMAYCNTPVYLARQKFRAMYKIPGSDFHDYCAACLCAPCTICQMRRHDKAFEEHEDVSRPLGGSSGVKWKRSLFHCAKQHDTRMAWLKRACCNCFTFAEQRKRMTGSESRINWLAYSGCLIGVLFPLNPQGSLLGYVSRSQLRAEHGIQGNMVEDAVAHFVCPSCALLQEELQLTAADEVEEAAGEEEEDDEDDELGED